MSKPTLDATEALNRQEGLETEPEDLAEVDPSDPFYNEGLSTKSKQALDYVDSVDTTQDESSETYLKRLIKTLEDCIAKNLELRDVHAKEPIQFLDSESELNDAIKAMSGLSQTTLYTAFIKSSGVGSLVSMLSHPNSDIVLQTVQVLIELVDADIEESRANRIKLAESLVDQGVIAEMTSFFEALGEKAHEADDLTSPVIALGEILASLVAPEFFKHPGFIKAVVGVFPGNTTRYANWQTEQLDMLCTLFANSPSQMQNVKAEDLIKIRNVSCRGEENDMTDKDEQDIAQAAYFILSAVCRDSNSKPIAQKIETVSHSYRMHVYGPTLEALSWKLAAMALTGLNVGELARMCAENNGAVKVLERLQNGKPQARRWCIRILASVLAHLPLQDEQRLTLVYNMTRTRDWRYIGSLHAHYQKKMDQGDEEALDALRDIGMIIAWVVIAKGHSKDLLDRTPALEKVTNTLTEYQSSLQELAGLQEVPDSSESSYELAMRAAEASEELDVVSTLLENL